MIPKTATLLGLEVGRAAAAVASASALTLGLGAIGIIAGIAAVMAVVNSNTKPKTPSPAGDISAPATGKTQVSTREGGLFELSKNDDLVAFPGASKALNNKNQPLIVNQTAPQQQSQAIDYDKMAQAMSRVRVQTNLDGVRVSSELQKAPLGMATRKI
jgi:hypothetical protein